MQGSILNGIYRVESQLSKRGSRSTWLANNLNTNEAVVIKILKFGLDAQWSDFRLFEREAQTLKNIDHPAIPNYLDYFELDLPDCKGFTLVQQYLAAPSLEETIKAGRTFSELEIREIAESLLNILLYLHQQQPSIVHRDIKPSNILLTDRSGNSVGQVYLIDFGAVKTIAPTDGGTITVVGTYGYMPPEQFGGYTTPASDLYSLGATLIYLATGRHPTELPRKNGKIDFAESVQFNYSLVRWLEQVVEPSCDHRFKSASKALSALRKPTIKQTTTKIIKQPEFSNIVLCKTAAEIDVLIPNTNSIRQKFAYCGWSLLLISLLLLLVGVGLFFASWLLGVLGFLLSIPLWLVGWYWFGYELFDAFGDTRLKINADQISLTYELRNIKRDKVSSSPRETIKVIEYGNHSQRVFGYREKSSPLTYNASEVVIWADAQAFRIESSLKGKNDIYLTYSPVSVELTWLTKELSEWLDLPLTYQRVVQPIIDLNSNDSDSN